MITSTQLLEEKNLPEKTLFIGGGYISFEFAHIMATAGSKVTIVHRGEKPLKGFEEELVDKAVENYRGKGINIILRQEPVEIKKEKQEYTVKLTSKNKITTNMIVHGAGREPNIHDLNLETAGVHYTRKGITVNQYLQSTTNPQVYAAGDAAATGKPLTPKAAYDGKIVGINASKGNTTKAQYGPIPTVVFTYPPLASVGLTEKQAIQEKQEYKVRKADTTNWYTSKRIKVKNTGYKILLDKKDRIIGAHLYMPGSEEAINLFALAMKNNMTRQQLKDVLYTYPTTTYDIKYMI